MGNQVVISVLTDALHEIQKNPQEFVDKLVRNIGNTNAVIGAANHCNAAEVLGIDHSGAYQLYLVHGNTGERITIDWRTDTATIKLYGQEYILKKAPKKRKAR